MLGALFAMANANASELSWNDPGRPIHIRPPAEMSVTMDVLVDGVPVRTIAYAGRRYLPVKQMGAEYEIRIRNHGSRRIAALVSVDGLSVINGRPASDWSPGYVVDPHSSILIKGWRRDLERVAAFSFEPRDDSYAARMGHPENVGVIEMLAIEEAARYPRPMPLERTDSARGVLKATPGLGGTGTGYGRDIDSGAIYVPFARSANTMRVTYHYDTVEALRRIGVPVDPYYLAPAPGDFAPPPPPRTP